MGAARVCRAATGVCDREERCNGTSAACPADLSADAGVTCHTTESSAWGACTSAPVCATTGQETRTRTEYRCNGDGVCNPMASNESRTCTRTTENLSCGATSYDNYSACAWPTTCATSGSRTRTRTEPVCQSGACGATTTTETDTAGCNRNTNGASCGTSQYGDWSTCSYASACATSGSRTRTRIDPVCQAGGCGTTSTTETDTTGCNRSTVGTTCESTQYGNWSTCAYSQVCSPNGSRTRTVSAWTCSTSGACVGSNTTETDISGCNRNPVGMLCRAADPSSCDFDEEYCVAGNSNCPTDVGGCVGAQRCCAFDGCTCSNCLCH